MSENRFQNKYRMPSARADWHSYEGGFFLLPSAHSIAKIILVKLNVVKCGCRSWENIWRNKLS